MIPPLNQSGALPPFLPGEKPTVPGAVAPYPASLLDVASHFGGTPERREILEGLIHYRSELARIGINGGFQWIDGSFVEDVEVTRGRPPGDVDIVTFAYRPPKYQELNDWKALIADRKDLFIPEESKAAYHCDAYFVDLGLPAPYLVHQTTYWFGLFSHQRESYLWKGLLMVPLGDDTNVKNFLDGGNGDAP
jgi:hypothetical protein